MATVSKKEADAWDRVLDAAAELAELIESSGIAVDERDLEELAIFLASNADTIRRLFKPLKRHWPPDEHHPAANRQEVV
jgi:uncharacterized protein